MIKLKNSIVCEDIRREVGNKYSLMGLLDEKIIFQEPEEQVDIWPKLRPLGFYFKFEADKIEEMQNVTSLSILTKDEKNSEKEIASFSTQKETTNTKIRVFASISNFAFTKKGKIDFFARFFDSKKNIIWENCIYTLNIEVSPVKNKQ